MPNIQEIIAKAQSKLELHFQSINDAQLLELIAFLRKNPHIIEIDLGANRITDVGIKALGAFLATNPPLQKISLWGNPFTSQGLIDLARALTTNTHLSHLNAIFVEDNSPAFPAIEHALLKNITCINLVLKNTTQKIDELLLRNKAIESLPKAIALGSMSAFMQLQKIKEQYQLELEVEFPSLRMHTILSMLNTHLVNPNFYSAENIFALLELPDDLWNLIKPKVIIPLKPIQLHCVGMIRDALHDPDANMELLNKSFRQIKGCLDPVVLETVLTKLQQDNPSIKELIQDPPASQHKHGRDVVNTIVKIGSPIHTRKKSKVDTEDKAAYSLQM